MSVAATSGYRSLDRLARSVLIFSSSVALGACSGSYWLGGSADASAGGAASLDGGVVYELGADVVLTGSDHFTRDGTSGGCTLLGHGHSIRSVAPWEGAFVLRNCRIVGLGTESVSAIDLEPSSTGSVTIEGCTFDASGMVHVVNDDASTSIIRNNTVLPSSLVPVYGLRNDSKPAFSFEGWDGTGQKYFQGNRIERSYVSFSTTTHWLIGGDTDAESNLIAGLRGGIDLDGTDLVVRGNYVHDVFPSTADQPSGNQESVIAVAYTSGPVLCEHNVLRHGHWIVRSFAGEFRYNVLLDIDATNFVQQPLDGARIHHNLMTMYEAPGAETGLPAQGVDAGIALINMRTTGIEIYNNTLDGGGAGRFFTGPAVSVESGSFLQSLRNNAFVRCPFARNDGTQAAVRASVSEGIDPLPERMGYADYNLFYDPEAQSPRIYGLGVAGKRLRLDSGFALNDAEPNGPIDQQVDPLFAGPFPDAFPWAEADILERRVTVSRMLKAWRAMYTPKAGSALIDHGDPADGAGTDIGAVGAGAADPLDRFGTFGQ